MPIRWQDVFTKVPGFTWKDSYTLTHPTSISTLENLKRFLDFVQIKFCLIRPFLSKDNYPLVSPQDLLPSFEANLYEYVDLPGFSMVAFDRPLNYFHEVFQFDLLHCVEDAVKTSNGPASPFEPVIIQQNHAIFQSRLPKILQDQFKKQFDKQRITELPVYPNILPFLLNMDRGHVLAKNSTGDFHLFGIYASFPSDLDSELKRFGLRIGKFKPGDNTLYELNRNFVYQFLMELYGFPIVSERRTSAALFSRRLFKMGEDFLIRVLGQSDRTITSLYSNSEQHKYPQVEKIALVSIGKRQKEQFDYLKREGYILDEDRPAVIVRVLYQQHKYDPNNIRTDRALSVSKQEVIHPLTGEVCTTANIIKDTSIMTFTLNDIVKGEYFGRIKYKRNEIVENTDTHAKRLKFLYAWLRKHQRRILSYSDEFYNNVTKVLDNYLLNTDYYDIFQQLSELYNEVWQQYSYIQQARKIKQLEDLNKKKYKGRKINYLKMLQHATQILQTLKFEAAHYFDNLTDHAIYMCDKILSDKYLIKKYITPPQSSLSAYGQEIRKLHEQLVVHINDLKEIQKYRSDNIPSFNSQLEVQN